MKFKKNLFSEILFSVIIAIILVVNSSELSSEVEQIVYLLFQSLAVYTVFFIWIKNISHDFSKKDWIVYTHGFDTGFFKSLFLIYKPFYKDFLLPKTSVLLIIFALSELLFQPIDDINTGKLKIILFQLFNTSLYFLMALYISLFFKTYWKKIFALLAIILIPFFFSILILNFANTENYNLLLILPSNLYLSIIVDFSVVYFLTGNLLLLCGIIISVILIRKKLVQDILQ
ncbi:hypothetical protein ES708_21693 [subsurface metagenome]